MIGWLSLVADYIEDYSFEYVNISVETGQF